MSKRDDVTTVAIRRADRATAPATVKVRLPAWRGAKRAGPYLAGQVYELPHDEAERLVRVKGFELVEEE